MNVQIYIIEAVCLALVFNAMIMIPLSRNPEWWIHDYPEDIQEEYFKTHERVPASLKDKPVLIKKGAALIFALIILTALVKLAGAKNFSTGFFYSYGLWSVINWYDCFFMDWVLFANMKSVRLPGTEHMDKAYHQKKYHFVRALYGAALGLLPSLAVGVLCMLF